MKTLTISTSIALFMAITQSCYQPEEQYTVQKKILLELSDDENIIADSMTLHRIVVKVPGIRYNDTVRVTLTTTWGYWPNRASTVTLLSAYNEETDIYEVSSYLKTARIASPFTIEANTTTNLNASFDFVALPNYPDTIQIVTDSLIIANKPGSFTTARAYFYSSNGYPSYGLRFGFIPNNHAIAVPLQEEFNKSKGVVSKIVISNETSVGELTVTGELKSTNGESVVILPARVRIVEP